MRISHVALHPLSVPLLEPFVIATGTMTTTRAALVSVTIEHEGARSRGLGEAAALPPVTACDQPELLAAAPDLGGALVGLLLESPEALAAALSERIVDPVLRAAAEAATLDAWGRQRGTPVSTLLGAGPVTPSFVTDITLPIGEPRHMADLATGYRARGFTAFKVKVGRSLDDDIRALSAVCAAVPDATLRIDANGGYRLDEARTLLSAAAHLPVECFEQPCARGEEEAMAALARESSIPIVLDESLRSRADLDRALALGAFGINLKLAKLGSLVVATELGRRARDAGLPLMLGAMVETRLGLTAMLHVATAIGAVTWLDLDTQLLLAAEAFRGGYHSDGPTLTLTGGAGLDLEECA